MHIYSEIEKNPLLHLCISEPLRLGHADIIAENPHGILAYDHPAHLHLLAADNAEIAAELLARIENPYFIFCCNGEFAPLVQRFGFSDTMHCRQAAWLHPHLPDADPRLTIAPPDDRAFARILDIYRMSSAEELTRQRNAGELFFAVDAQGNDVGFVGLHPEGCFGLLHVLPEQRGRGYGAALEKFIIRFCRETGRVPYCQVSLENAVSLQLQQKLGLAVTPETLFMAWNGFYQG